MKDNRPNIVLILLDTTRADHLSCYGYYRMTSPNIDSIAAQGTLFENAISPAQWTAPAIASLFTGMFPSKHGVYYGSLFLRTDIPTLAEVLAEAGYVTAGFSSVGWVSRHTEFSRGFETFEEIFWTDSNLIEIFSHAQWKILSTLTNTHDSGMHRINKKVRSWLRRGNGDRPFFLYLHYLESHLPYIPPRPFNRLYHGDGMGLRGLRRLNQDADKYIAGKVDMTEEDFKLLESQYDGEIAYQDFKLDEIFGCLKELNILDDTLLIITADHGENIGHHGLMGHEFCLYDTLLRVPLILRYPKLFPGGLRVPSQVQTVDIFPTILDILELDHERVREEIQGVSFLSGMNDSAHSRFAISEQDRPLMAIKRIAQSYPDFDETAYDRQLRAVRLDGFKYIWASDGKDELYNLASDPGEQDNLIDSYSWKAAELRAKLFDWIHSFEAAEAITGYSEDELNVLTKHLRDLGYL